jgi:chorismate mutase
MPAHGGQIMSQDKFTKYYLVEASIVPEIFIKVTKAKELLEAGDAATVAEAVAAAGISRSAFYKYKDYISAFTDLKRGHVITYHIMLRDRKGVLSGLLSVFADSGANILTINQSIPINGSAAVTISAETEAMNISSDELMSLVKQREGVIKIEVLAG